jgi:hypothetical protein
MQEEIKIKGESTRTIVKYFTNFSGRTGAEDKTYFVVTDINDQPLKLTDSEFDTRFSLNSENYYVELSATTVSYKIYSGTVVETEFKQGLTQDEKDSIAARFTQKINLQANPTNQSNSVNNPFSCVFFEEYPFTDYFMNVKINQSVNSLDTLNVYNVALGETPKFTNDTGVLVGKLEAVQVLSDENGEKIRIPLKNTVVGIFNPSEAFPNIASTDEDGNRIRLNLYETLPQIDSPFDLKGYSSFQAYLTDVSYSTKDNSNPSIPEQYRYTTITNERGEFILHNVPTGQQTLMIEVDLLKFGLDPEEVALNFFPYPTQEEPNVSEIPHLFFGQYPINIVPSWGDFQTGYTEMTLSVSLDLRKWCTYQIFPISAKYGLNSTKPYVMEELFTQGYTNAQTVLIRDMTKPLKVFDRPKVEIVKIPDIYDRNTDLRSAWNNEFKTKNNKVEFDVTAFNAFKLPANLYDPNGTNSRGEKGVWLNAYTFKVYYPDETVSFNASGMAGTWDSEGKEIFANHFDFSFTADAWWSRIPAGARFAPSAIGTWPYEKAWSLTYPDAYKVTKRPVVKNPYKEWDQNNNHKTNVDGFNVIPQLEPRYLDGDLIGGDDAWATNANGFGLQDYQPGIYGNMFAREVSKNETWRYEAIDWWADDFANGFNPGCTPGSYKYSKVPGCPPAGRPDISADVAERFMRLEAGYNYWLMPRGWPRIDVRNGWGDLLLVNDIKNVGNSVYPGYYPKRDGVYQYIDDVTLIVGQRAPWWSRFGRITAYRVEKPYYTLPKRPPFVEKFVKLHFGPLYFDGTSPNGGSNRDRTLPNLSYSCGDKSRFNRIYGIKIKIKNTGSIKIFFQGKELFPEEEIEVTIASADASDDAAQLTLPANSAFNPLTNSYERADYEFYIFQGYSGNFPACNPYSSGTGELVSVWLWPWNQYGGCVHRLKYEYDNRYGLPAFTEDEAECNYWLTSRPAFPCDFFTQRPYGPGNCFYSYDPEDKARNDSYIGAAVFRLQGLYWMANHNGNQGWSFFDPALRWTQTHPSEYLRSRFLNGNNCTIALFGGKPLSFRFVSGGGFVGNLYDLDFRNIK